MRCQTSVAICTVLMAAAHFPEEQAKVQAELDAVIGRERGSSILHRSSVNRMISLPKYRPSLTNHPFLVWKHLSLRH